MMHSLLIVTFQTERNVDILPFKQKLHFNMCDIRTAAFLSMVHVSCCYFPYSFMIKMKHEKIARNPKHLCLLVKNNLIFNCMS